MFVEIMPYRGDSPVEAWEYWFDEPPSEGVRSSLEQCGNDYAATAATIIEAIVITGKRTDITDEAARIQYVKGILRRKLLHAMAPARAEEVTQIDSLQWSWNKKGVWSWPLDRKKASFWLQYCSVAEIKELMRIARSWTDFKEQLNQIIESRQPTKTETETETETEIPVPDALPPRRTATKRKSATIVKP